MKKKVYVCPQTDIQKVETGILCVSCVVIPGGGSEGPTGGSIGGGGIF